MNHETALITGASSGIGLHLAEEFASHGHPVILVAPVESELQRVADDLRARFACPVKILAADLADEASIQALSEALHGRQVDILVNNAGHGQRGNAWEIPIETDISMLRVNIEAVVRMTKIFLPPMVQRGTGRILNTASVAGFEPGPGYAVYASSKAFVLSYSQSIATELEGTGVTVTALCPGPTDTDFFPKADMTATRAFQQSQLMAPQNVAAEGYRALMQGDRVVVPGMMNKALVFARRLLPESVQAKLNDALTDDVSESQQKRERGDREFTREG
jgi:short-subunit dehydrogenase